MSGPETLVTGGTGVLGRRVVERLRAAGVGARWIGGLPEREAGLLGRFAYRSSRRRFGKVAEPLTVTAHHPRLLVGYGAFELALDSSRLVDEGPKSLAETKVAATVGCELCIDIGSVLGRRSGVSEGQLRDLHGYAKSEAFSPLEKLVLEYAEVIPDTGCRQG